ncbi:MAG: hypothetical protein BGO57_06555 [Sphingomonadales bacterium 63-6]|nr:MAG: hypothetical protein BGO57_06555 [Sphingomonadales bacterium 63-6]
MLLSASISVIWLLAMLAAAAMLRDVRRTFFDAIKIGLGFAATLNLALIFNPQPNWIGVLVGLLASWRLIAGPMPRMGGVIGGACAALVAALQIGGGIPGMTAAAVAGGALAIAFLLVRSGSAHSRTSIGIGSIALLLAALGAPLAGLLGDLLYGWQSATMLAQDAAQPPAPPPPAWALAITGLALAAGLFKGMWIKR